MMTLSIHKTVTVYRDLASAQAALKLAATSPLHQGLLFRIAKRTDDESEFIVQAVAPYGIAGFVRITRR